MAHALHPVDAIALGYTIDTFSTYPWLGYQGARFAPKATVSVYTYFESYAVMLANSNFRDYNLEECWEKDHKTFIAACEVVSEVRDFNRWWEYLKWIDSRVQMDDFETLFGEGLTPGQAYLKRFFLRT